ncbi:hypothetical protein MP228_007820 [Amoeboaphelidium protococcarum]|nr:hypothetical protein MP228_007820 [Amoeboaphelidium protococcarum]
MIAFRETYEQSCRELGIEPLAPLVNSFTLQNGGEGPDAANVKPSSLQEAIADINDTIDAHPSIKQQRYSRILDLSGQSLDLKMTKALSEALSNDQLFQVVSLSDCQMGDDGCIVLCQALKHSDNVQKLDLKGNNIRTDGALALAQYVKLSNTLTWLSLEWNQIGLWETAMQSLADGIAINCSIQYLNLSNNKIGPDGCLALYEAMKSNKSLVNLDLRWNNIGLNGGKQLVKMFHHNYTLLQLQVDGSEMPDDIQQSIRLALQRNAGLATSRHGVLEAQEDQNDDLRQSMKSILRTSQRRTPWQSASSDAEQEDDIENFDAQETVQQLNKQLKVEISRRKIAEKRLLQQEAEYSQERESSQQQISILLQKLQATGSSDYHQSYSRSNSRSPQLQKHKNALADQPHLTKQNGLQELEQQNKELKRSLQDLLDKIGSQYEIDENGKFNILKFQKFVSDSELSLKSQVEYLTNQLESSQNLINKLETEANVLKSQQDQKYQQLAEKYEVLKSKLSDERHGEVNRAKKLEKAVSEYVKSVEKARKKTQLQKN